jgi:uncharacterized protein YbjT (DUF2867 family)
MKIILFGATGMVGQGVLRECLLDPEVTKVLAVVRSSTGQRHAKLEELIHRDFFDFTAIADQLTGYDACFFCLGVSSAGMKEKDYRRVTYDLTLAAARVLVQANPRMTFVYVSGYGTDTSEHGRIMWARVKGATENALLGMGFGAAYMFRPAIIQPLDGIRPKAALVHTFYVLFRPLFPVLRAVAPQYLTTTACVGRAMLAVAKHGAASPIVGNREIESLGTAA